MEKTVLPLLKARLGISSEVRDPLLAAIIKGIVSECKETYGIELKESPDHILFVLDWATWKYQHPEDGVTPRSIQFRLKNLIIKKECTIDESDMG
ncbi:hypothetical protein [Claveliimonas bilis]|uniref:hypothetical protein n=1 Tax=Claveliimonas bilis TaxID=3028070 RepID=UPI002931DD6E|nr:hypothetical protein [Claveliimonas bilis]BDZ81412.1 hypothetical protein Lac3_26210 [Claveliimonas bilis]